MTDPLREHQDWARRWLFDAALPLWWERGADRENGGWFEHLDQSGAPTAAPKRCRVQARQTYVYAQAKRLGWSGADDAQIRHGIDFLDRAYRRADGFYRKAAHVDGSVADDGFDLYDQAFVLLALVSGYQALGEPTELRDQALRLLDLLGERLAHPGGGFQEDSPPRLPLRSNPHMHMLEALLAWTQAGGGAAFEERARQITDLATRCFLDPATGAVGEYFDADWRFLPGDEGGVREPGHQFEWAFLLTEAAEVLGGDHRAAVERLERFGRTQGIDGAREVAVFATDAAGTITDADARLWSQTERLRTALVLGAHVGADDAARFADDAARAGATIRRYLDVPVAGLWRDRMLANGTLVDEPAPASSFYHIVSALLPLLAR